MHENYYHLYLGRRLWKAQFAHQLSSQAYA